MLTDLDCWLLAYCILDIRLGFLVLNQECSIGHLGNWSSHDFDHCGWILCQSPGTPRPMLLFDSFPTSNCILLKICSRVNLNVFSDSCLTTPITFWLWGFWLHFVIVLPQTFWQIASHCSKDIRCWVLGYPRQIALIYRLYIVGGEGQRSVPCLWIFKDISVKRIGGL